MVNIVLNIIGVILIARWFINHKKDYKSTKIKKTFFKFNRFKSIIISFLIITIPILIINFTSIESENHISDAYLNKNKYIFSILVSFLISLVWLIYIYRLDIFNKEKKRNIFLIILLSSILTSFAEIPYNFIHSLGFTDTINPVDSFIYSVFGIGLIEETIKFIPLIIILWFTKAIDEPYDYILYASASALGFSFVENTMYLNQHGIEIISARALYATVAHMTFSSMIAYGLFLIKFKKTQIPAIIIFPLFCFLAIFSHGFYDFWLINKSVSAYSGLTTIFFLTTVHIWFSIKNNTINTSNYYNKTKFINNDKIKVYLIISLLSILMFSYVYVALKWNSKTANVFLLKSTFVYGYIIFYLIATLSKFNLTKDLIKPFKLSFKHLIPKKQYKKRDF
ncbi:MAG TPA: PrsW family intramembrane metalloprotease [Crocinitomix sp.]|nr:PrsW family intramembrane metalloprotease [Crocinitomix sp.]